MVDSFTYAVIIYSLDGFDGRDAGSTVSYVEIDLDADFGIPKGSATASERWTLYPGMDTVKLEWEAIPCEFPPKEDDVGRATPPGLRRVG